MKFELNRLPEYSDEAILAELKRVAGVINPAKLTMVELNKHSRVHSTTLIRRFGGFLKALDAAGLSKLADDRVQKISKLTNGEIIELIKQVADKLRKNTLTLKEFYEETGITPEPIHRRFGSWKNALKEAGLSQSKNSLRYSDEECFENMLRVWTYYGRPPKHREMNMPPSTVGSKAYVLRWKTWNKALYAFVDWISIEEKESVFEGTRTTTNKQELFENRQNIIRKTPREATPRQKILVWVRDNHKCRYCGRSPAKDPEIILHVDHVIPWSKGGETVVENLQTLCSKCNLGKSDLEV